MTYIYICIQTHCHMKRLLPILLTIALVNTTFSQNLIFSENFDKYSGLGIGGGWNTSIRTGVVPWRTSDMYNLYCANSKVPQQNFWDRVAAINDCHDPRFGPVNNSNVLMYTPSINLSGATGAILKFDSYFNKQNDNGHIEQATVEVSVNNGVSWTVIHSIPPGATDDSFSTHYINLSAYRGYSNLLIGFRYADKGGDHQQGGWALDNIELFEPYNKDLALTMFTPQDSLDSYTQINNTIVHQGVVYNFGNDTADSFIINYRRDTGPVLSDTFNIPLPSLSSYHFSHKIPDTITRAGVTNITAWVSFMGDQNHQNDTLKVRARGVYFIPGKLVVVEEGTATWNGFGPKGIVYMHILDDDYNASLISIHNGDPMENAPYSDYLYDLKYYSEPYFLVDRHLNVDATSLPALVNKYNEHFGFADIELRGVVEGNKVRVYTTVIPAVDIQADLRLAMVLTENNVRSIDSGYEQKNFYAQPAKKLGPMGGFETRGDPVPASEIVYDFVARDVVPSADGDSTFPNRLEYGKRYTHTFETELKPEWDKYNMLAIVMLLNNDDTIILNSNKLTYFLDISKTSNEDVNTVLYPNPANDICYLEFDVEKVGDLKEIIVTDINGRIVNSLPVDNIPRPGRIPINTHALIPGIYIVNLKSDKTSIALKMQVVH